MNPLCQDLHYLTTKPGVSVALFVRKLLCRLQADGHQTWQEGQGRAQKKSRGTRFHGNQCVAMATKKRKCFLWPDQNFVGYKVAHDVMDVIRSMTSLPMTSP